MKRLFSYSLLLMLDKGIAFALPLLVLFVTKNNLIYTQIETVLALAIFLSPILDLGVRHYVGFVFREKGIQSLQSFDNLMIFISISLVSLSFVLIAVPNTMILISLSLFRSLYVNLFQYSQIRGRLTDQLTAPILLNLIVIGTSSTVFVVLYFAEVGIEILLFSYFALPPIMFLYSTYRQVKGNLSIRFSSGNEWKFLKACIMFSAPAALNTLLVIGFSNLTKVYVLNVFGEDEMVRYVFSFRIAMIIQLCHMVVSGYSYKFFLLSQDYKKMMKYYSAYSMSLVAISLLIVLFIVLLDSFSNSEFTKVDLLLVCSFGYTLFWCFSSFFDFLYIRIGKTKLMLVNSIVFFLTYILFYGISGISNPTDAAIGLFFSSTTMFISNLVIIWCHRDSIIQVE